MLVEAAWTAAKAPGPLRAFYHRVKNRRGFQIAVVATARKMLVLAWHLVQPKDQDYAFARPSLVAFKRRKLELAAGAPKAHAHRGAGYDYNDKQLAEYERDLIETQRACLRTPRRELATIPAGWRRPDRVPSHLRGGKDAIEVSTISSVVQITRRISTSYSRNGTNSAPGAAPELDDRRIPLAPLVRELGEPVLRCLLGRSRVNRLERTNDRGVAVPPAGVAGNQLRIRWTMHCCTTVCSQVVLIASGSPLRPSQTAMSTSSTPRFFTAPAEHLQPEPRPFRAVACPDTEDVAFPGRR